LNYQPRATQRGQSLEGVHIVNRHLVAKFAVSMSSVLALVAVVGAGVKWF